MNDLGDVILARLRERAKADCVVPDAYFLRWTTEGLLRRLERTRYAHRFALKGANLFPIWYGNWNRVTRDIDFEGLFEEDADDVADIIRAVCGTALPDDDGIRFHLDTLNDRVLGNTALPGHRIRLNANLGTAKVWLRVDVSFSHPVVIASKPYRFPSLLPDGQRANVLGATRESSIADRLAMMVEFGSFNTRLKDYYDVWRIIRTSNIRADYLAWALSLAFLGRDAKQLLEAPGDKWSSGFGADFVSQDALRRWEGWLKQQHASRRPELSDVLFRVRQFAVPILRALREGRPLTGAWDPGRRWHRNSDACYERRRHDFSRGRWRPGVAIASTSMTRALSRRKNS